MASYRDAPDAVVLGHLAQDPVALEELFRRHRRAVLEYAARRCQRPADVDDVVAATFLAALESASRYDPAKGEVRAWLLGIAHNQLGLLRRREGRERSVEGAFGGRAELSADAFNRLIEQIAATQDDVRMQRAPAQLPADQREALLLVGSDGLTPKEAAAAPAISAAAFRVRLFRARRALRALLQGVAETSPTHPSVPKEVQR